MGIEQTMQAESAAPAEPDLTEQLLTTDEEERATLLCGVFFDLGEAACKKILDLRPNDSMYQTIRSRLNASGFTKL